MNTRYLMRASAILAALLGVVASFLPQGILTYAGAVPGGVGTVIVQVAGALYLGLAALNWTAQGNLIGGIYSRPVALANFMHFAVGAIAMLKVVVGGEREVAVLLLCAAYSLFAVLFGTVLFTSPSGLGNGGAK